jgi:cytochrome oxidase Cu insertion factor (SCO1/SenC/PrrC family)
MSGMGSHLQTDNFVIVAAFHALLKTQFFVLVAIAGFLWLGWAMFRTIQSRRLLAAFAATAAGVSSSSDDAKAADVPSAAPEAAIPEPAIPEAAIPEPVARRVLRIGFGLLWLLDGLLQLQSSMPLGLPVSVLQPASGSSPGWVQHLVNFGVTTWSDHPIEAAVSAVWIQVGIGILLLAAPRGRWSRFAGLASVGWGLVVWVFGEAFGGVFGSGVSWLFGAPGAALFYCLAGALLALPEAVWSRRQLGRILVGAFGVFFAGMAVLQAWPGRGFWQGRTAKGAAGSLVGMVKQMASTPQPRFLSEWLSSFGAAGEAHGFAVNLVVVVLLAAIGVTLCTGRPALVRFGLGLAVLVGLADWVLVQDFGFLGGVGTDPNSILPTLLILVAGCLAITHAPDRPPVPTPGAAPAPSPGAATASGSRTWSIWQLRPGYVARATAAIGALAAIGLGAIPMAVASGNPNADPILAIASNGTPNIVDFPAPGFSLTDTAGRPVSLGQLRGRTVVLTFLDPVCTSDCPIIAQEFRRADRMLGSAASRVDFVAVVANPVYRSTVFTAAFDRQEGLDNMANWNFLTGSAKALEAVWTSYGIEVGVAGGGAMVAHSDLAYIIDASGHTRAVLDSSPGSGAASASSFSVLLSQQIKRVLGS